MPIMYAPGALGLPAYERSRPHQAVEGVAPPGMEHVVQKLKRSGKVQNPFALAWWMKKHGGKRGMAVEGGDTGDADLAHIVAEAERHGIPSVFAEAANGAAWAQAWCMQEPYPMVYQEQR